MNCAKPRSGEDVEKVSSRSCYKSTSQRGHVVISHVIQFGWYSDSCQWRRQDATCWGRVDVLAVFMDDTCFYTNWRLRSADPPALWPAGRQVVI